MLRAFSQARIKRPGGGQRAPGCVERARRSPRRAPSGRKWQLDACANLIDPPSYPWFTGTMGGRRVAHSLATFRPCGPTPPPSICLGAVIPASTRACEALGRTLSRSYRLAAHVPVNWYVVPPMESGQVTCPDIRLVGLPEAVPE